MKGKGKKRREASPFVSPKMRRALLRHLRKPASRVSREKGTVTDVTSFRSVVSFGKGKGMHSHVFPAWFMRSVNADEVGAKVIYWISRAARNILVVRLKRTDRAAPLTSPRLRRCFTKADERLLHQDPLPEDDDLA